MQSISFGAGILNYNKTRLSKCCWQHLIYTLRNSNKYKPNVNVSDLSAVYLSTKFSKPQGSFISLEISLPNRNAHRLDRGWRSILNPVLEARCFQEGKGQQEFLCRLKLSIGVVTLRYADATRQVKLSSCTAHPFTEPLIQQITEIITLIITLPPAPPTTGKPWLKRRQFCNWLGEGKGF